MIARRRILQNGLAASATGVPLVAMLSRSTGWARASESLERQTLVLQSGRPVIAYLALPRRQPAPAIMVVHEWWGLTERIKAVAQELSAEGYVALAIDLMRGRTATVRNDAKRLLGQVGRTEALEICGGWLRWLKAHPAVSGGLATIGWGFGGGWALSAATVEPVAGTVVYYGRVNHPTTELSRLEGPVMGHFALHDVWINRDMVTLFERGMLKARKRSIIHWYDAGHAFADSADERFDRKDAALAWRRTLKFFDAVLG